MKGPNGLSPSITSGRHQRPDEAVDAGVGEELADQAEQPHSEARRSRAGRVYRPAAVCAGETRCVEPGAPAWRAPPGYAGAGYPFRNHCAGCDTLNQLRSSEKIAVSSTFSSRLLTITGATGHATVPMTGRVSEKNCQTSAR